MATKTLPAGTEADRLKACSDLFLELAAHACTVQDLMTESVDALGSEAEPNATLATTLAFSARALARLIGAAAELGLMVAGGAACRDLNSWLFAPVACKSVELALGTTQVGGGVA